jgi:hypothetical protein
LLADLNARPMRLYRASRRELFERLDQPALRSLPAEAFVYSEWKIGARVNIDYHIELHGHYYSVPYTIIHESVDARLTATTVEIFHRGQRVAAHRRSPVRGRHTTDAAHMPKAHHNLAFHGAFDRPEVGCVLVEREVQLPEVGGLHHRYIRQAA